jgi:hypothetical protein
MNIRFKKIVQFLIFGKGGTVFYLFSIIVILGYFLLGYMTNSWLHSYFRILMLLIIFPTFLYLINSQFRYWIKNKSELFLLENFFFLMLFGFYISIFFGSLDYVVYKSNPNSFILSNDYTNALNKNEIPIIQDKINGIEKNISDLEKINKLIKQNDTLKYDDNNVGTWVTNSPDISIKYIYLPPHIGATEYHELQILYKGKRYFLFNQLQNSDIRIFNCYDKSFNSQIIKKLIEQKIDIKNKYRLQLELDVSKLSISYFQFVYFKVLSSLNYDIGLYRAYSAIPRFLELLYALFRFVYFGFFIALILESWEKSTSHSVKK